MTGEDLALLKASEGRVLAVELSGGEQFFAEIVIVVDEPPTPDVFVLRIDCGTDGAMTATSMAGESYLLAEIARVTPVLAMEYPEG